jgi:hypothetical protein
MNHPSRLSLIFALTFTIFIIAPAFLGTPFGPFPLMSWGDFLDLFTSIALIPLYWMLFRAATRPEPTLRASILFAIFATLWAQGQGMHLVANSIGHLLDPDPGSLATTLTFQYDEYISHFIWHGALLALSALILFQSWWDPSMQQRSHWGWLIPAGLLYGFTFASASLEGRTVILGFPFALLVVLLVLGWGRARLPVKPLIAFFFLGYLVAAILIGGWALYWGGFLEPSVVLSF